MSPRSKYGAVKTTVDGITFASKKEAKRYQELRLLEKAGEIRDLRLQPEYRLHAFGAVSQGDRLIGAYRADFGYFERTVAGWTWVVEDVKSAPTKTPLYRWKKKHVEAQYGIEIREV